MSKEILDTLVDISLDSGYDDDVGCTSESPGTWAALYTFEVYDYIQHPCFEGLVGCILYCDSQGFYDYVGYTDTKDLASDWDNTVAELTLDDELNAD